MTGPAHDMASRESFTSGPHGPVTRPAYGASIPAGSPLAGGRAAQPDDVILETRGLVKDFKGFRAVDSVDLRVVRGQVHALIGPNGAGKTTCFNLLTKFLEPTAGSIHFNGRDITHAKPSQLARQGLVRSFQISATFPNLTVLENVRVALQRKLGTEFNFWRSPRTLAVLDDEAKALLARVGLESFADVLAVEMPYGRKRALEIATTLALDPELMLLDEPTQGMGHEDVDAVMELIARVAENRTILMVEHNMKVVSGISDRITVLARGGVLAEGSYADITAHPQVVEAYMGTAQEGFEEALA
jgi:branched-chain amino acid transport system ATP-binding protein